MVENAPVKDLIEFLRKHDIASVATVKENGQAHATTIFYYVEDDLKIYFLTKYDTLKFKNLKTNFTVGLVITDEPLYQSVQIEGTAKEVDYSHEFSATVKKFTDNLAKNGKDWEGIPLNHMTAGYFAFVQITPTWIRWVDFKNWGHIVKYEQNL